LFDDHATDGFAPASTNKVVTAVAALAALGPDDRFATRVVQGSNSASTAAIVLVGGGDPTLSTQGPGTDPGYRPASLDDLAARTADALHAKGVNSVTLGYDASVFSGPGLNPTWSPDYTDGNVAPVTGLMVDEGRAKAADDLSPRVTDPAAVAAADFAGRLAAHGVQVLGKPAAASAASAASAGSGAELASVTSPRLADLVEHMLTVSDNDLAESLLRHVAVADGKAPTFDGGVAAVRDQLGKLGLDLTGLNVLDGSGLSRKDSITPAFEVRVLSVAAADAHPELRAALTGLPVAGFTGTLAEDGRYTVPPSVAGAGLVRAKTGSLSGVVTLAGLVRDSSGELLAFSLMADAAPDATAARAAVDRLATTLAGCGCGSGSSAAG